MFDSLQPNGLHSPWNSPGQNTGVGSRSLLLGIFPTQGSTRVSCTAGGFFTSWATREARLYRTYATKEDSQNIKRWLLITENQLPPVKELSAFLYMGRCQSLDSLIIPLICTSAVWVQCSVFPHPECPQSSPWTVAADRGLLDDGYPFPSWDPSGFTSSSSWWPQLLATVTSIVYWFGRKYSITY